MQEKIKLIKINNFLHNEFKSALDNEIERKRYNSEIALLKDEEQTCIAKISTSQTDRDGECVDPKGLDTEAYMQNPIVLLNHAHSDLPIGKITQIEKQANAVFAKIQFASTEKGKEVWELVKGGFLRACSIGFIPQNYITQGMKNFREKALELGADIAKTVKIITRAELIENSLVTIPCNENALIIAISNKSLNLSEEMLKALNMDIVSGKPFPNEHSFRQHDPSKYVSFRRQKDKLGKGIDVIYGITQDGKAEIQTIRVDSSMYTYAEAKKIVEEAGFKVSEGEEATGEKEIKDVDNQSHEQDAQPVIPVESNPPNPPTEKPIEATKEVQETITVNGCVYRLVVAENKESEVRKEVIETTPEIANIIVENNDKKIEENKEEVTNKPSVQWNVIRSGPRTVTDQDLDKAKALKKGKIM